MSIEPPSIQLGEIMRAIEDRLPYGRQIVAFTLFVGVAAFVAACLTTIAHFLDSVAQTILRRPTQWPVITLGELITMAALAVVYVLVSRGVTRIIKSLTATEQKTVDVLERAASAIRRSTDAVERAEVEIARLRAELDKRIGSP
jgi:hypothetical protein